MSAHRNLLRNRRDVSRRALSSALIGAYAIVAVGIPLPTNRPVKSGELFPCSGCPCGCDSAEHCWRSCCCHTLAERLAWAEDHGVKPPDFVLALAQKAGLDSGGRPLRAKVLNVALATPTCCREQQPCCAASDKLPACCAARDRAHDCKPVASSFVVGWRALGCRGQSIHWLAAVPTLISVELNLSDQLPRVTWLGPHSSDVAAGVSDVPTPPPPERA
jgi:hypothetical protein